MELETVLNVITNVNLVLVHPNLVLNVMILILIDYNLKHVLVNLDMKKMLIMKFVEKEFLVILNVLLVTPVVYLHVLNVILDLTLENLYPLIVIVLMDIMIIKLNLLVKNVKNLVTIVNLMVMVMLFV